MADKAGAASPMVCVAQIATAHGVRGALKLRCFTEAPENVLAYGPLCDEQGRELFEIRVIGQTPGGLIVQAEGVTDRDAAEALRGLRLYVPRDRLPEPEEGEFYHEDLAGLVAMDEGGQPVGRVVGVFNFGAGDVIEVELAQGRREMVPFTHEAVPDVDIDAGFLTVRDAFLPEPPQAEPEPSQAEEAP